MINAILYESCALYYLYIAGKTIQINLPAYIEQFLAFFEEYNFDVLWIMPGGDFSKFISWDDFDKIDRDRCKVFPNVPSEKQKRPNFVGVRRLAQKKGEYHKDRYFAFIEHGEWSANNKNRWFTPDPYILAETLEYLSKELNLDILWSPGNLGQKVLDRIFTRKKITIQPIEKTKRIEEMVSHASVRPVWRRYEGLTEDQMGMQYLHAYDKNSQYAGAAQSVYLGIGQPIEVGPEDFNLQRVGFWKYRILDVGDSQFDGYELPCPLEINRTWASSDLILAARTFKIEFEILGGLVYERGAKLLEEWSKEMRLHRINLRDNKDDKYPISIARENAEGTVKLATNSLMGRLAKPRPDWNIAIVHRAIVNQMYSFNKFQRDYGIKPVLVSTDNFWIVSNESNPSLAIPGILEYENEQRGYKWLGTVKMSDEIIGMFRQERPDVINSYLKKEVLAYVESV